MDADALLSLAFLRSPAAEANTAIQRAREEVGGGLALATSYELVLPEEGQRAFLLERVLPRLVDFLESTGAKLPEGAGVFLSIFAGDTLYFVRAGQALQLFSQWSGLTFEELRRRYGPR